MKLAYDKILAVLQLTLRLAFALKDAFSKGK